MHVSHFFFCMKNQLALFFFFAPCWKSFAVHLELDTLSPLADPASSSIAAYS